MRMSVGLAETPRDNAAAGETAAARKSARREISLLIFRLLCIFRFSGDRSHDPKTGHEFHELHDKQARVMLCLEKLFPVQPLWHRAGMGRERKLSFISWNCGQFVLGSFSFLIWVGLGLCGLWGLRAPAVRRSWCSPARGPPYSRGYGIPEAGTRGR